MLEKAKAKLRSETDQNKNNPYVQVVGGFLLQYLNENSGAAEKILAADKTILKSLDAMKSEASRKKVGSYAVLTDSEGFEVVLKYFGITGSPPVPAKVDYAAGNYRPSPPAPAPAPVQKSKDDFDINLEDLL